VLVLFDVEKCAEHGDGEQHEKRGKVEQHPST
jgi:hypothetical protein